MRPNVRRMVPYLLAIVFLAVGYAHLAPGAALPPSEYRAWAFEHQAYSDILALRGDHYGGGGHPVPYLEDRIEYPVLLGFTLWLPSFLPGGALAHFTATYLLLSLSLLLAMLALDRIPGASAWWLGATPAIAVYAGLNWDLLAVGFLAAAAYAHARGRPGASGVATALGISTKLFPGTFAAPALAGYLGARERNRFGISLAAVLLAVNLPFAIAAPTAWSWFFLFNGGRKSVNSIWEVLHVPRGGPTLLLSLGPLLLATAFACIVARDVARSGRDPGRAVRLGTALALVVWIALNKVWSPQYALYGFFAGALVAAPAVLFVALAIVSLVDHRVAFELLAGTEPGFKENVFYPEAVVRTLAWLGLAAWIAVALRRVQKPQ